VTSAAPAHLLRVIVAAHCALSKRAEEFYAHAGGIMADANMKLRVMLLS